MSIARISALPGHLVNQIAAGEVIERPSSVVKELIENAIDAGAGRIDIELEGGGIEKIQIRDDGCGIHPDDMELAIHRHSTSKITNQEDLEAIISLGFRGEALSSIASVSDFSMTSRIAAMEHGVQLKFDPYTAKYHISPAARHPGTTVIVDKLFQTVPARRKFLRSQRTEFLHIQDTVRRIVLSRLDIAFYFYHNRRLLLGCPAIVDEQAGPRIGAVMGSQFLANAWQIDSQVDGMRVWGWLGNELAARSQSDRQYLYMNHRIIRDRHINHAIRQSLREIIADTRYPSYILFLDLDPAEVDVNVHPTKQEVRFRHARNIHDFIHAALREVINQKRLDSDVNQALYINAPGTTLNKNNTVHHSSFDLAEYQAAYAVSHQPTIPGPGHKTPLGTPLSMVHDHFLISLHDNGPRIIDLKAMMHYYIYSTLRRDSQGSQVKHRPLLIPLMLTLAQPEFESLLQRESHLRSMGIEVTESGPMTLSIRSIPSMLPGLDVMRLLREFSQISESDASDCINRLLNLIADIGSEVVIGMELNDAKPYLQKMAHLDLPFGETHYPGLWRTMTRHNLLNLLNGRNTPN